MPIAKQKMDVWTKLVIFFLWSGPFLGKASAFVGLALGPLMFLDSRVLVQRWYQGLTGRNSVLSGFSWALLLSVFYGFVQVAYGLLSGYPPVTVFQVFVFNLCPLYLFLGLWAGERRPGLMRSYVRYSAWFAVLYTPLFFAVLSKLNRTLPGDIDLFPRPGSGIGTLLGLFAYEPNLLRFWLPILILTFLAIANQIRADWLGLGIALLLWGGATRKLGRVFGIAGLLVLLLLIGFVADVRLPPLPGRGGELSARETVSRGLAVVMPGISERLGTSTQNERFYNGTMYWRQVWWRGIREGVWEKYSTLVFGFGYGFPIKQFGVNGMKDANIRSPHSIFYFTLGYSGVVGVALFFWLQYATMRLLWSTYRATGQIYGLANYCALLVGAFFGNFLETPQGGIFTYVMAGLCVGPMFCAGARPESERDVLLRPARRLARARSLRRDGRSTAPSLQLEEDRLGARTLV